MPPEILIKKSPNLIYIIWRRLWCGEKKHPGRRSQSGFSSPYLASPQFWADTTSLNLQLSHVQRY